MRLPRRPNWLTFIQAVPGIFSESDLLATVVPEDFVTADVDGEEPVAVIACPCGETPSVALARSKACNCRRIFLNLGSEVRVYRPDHQEDAAPEDQPGE
jgi:hypothetical protein